MVKLWNSESVQYCHFHLIAIDCWGLPEHLHQPNFSTQSPFLIENLDT